MMPELHNQTAPSNWIDLKRNTRFGVIKFDAAIYPLIVFLIGGIAAYIFTGKVILPIIPVFVVAVAMAVLPGLLRFIALLIASASLLLLLL